MDTSWMSSSIWILTVAVMVLAGWVKGVAGMGLPTIGIALMVIFMSQAEAAAMLVVPTVLTNFWQVRPLSRLPVVLSRVGGMQVTVVIGTLTAGYVLGPPAGAWGAAMLGGTLVLYAVWGLRGMQLHIPRSAERILTPAVGLVNGILTAITGVSATPAAPYLQNLGMERDDLIQALGVLFSVSTLALAVSLWLNGVFTPAVAGTSLLLFIPAWFGMWLGERFRKTLSPAVFRKYFLASLILLGGYQIVKAIMTV